MHMVRPAQQVGVARGTLPLGAGVMVGVVGVVVLRGRAVAEQGGAMQVGWSVVAREHSSQQLWGVSESLRGCLRGYVCTR